MKQIKITQVDSLSFYQNCLLGNSSEDAYRNELMKPLEPMWQYLQVPLCPKTTDGYDVLLASEMMGIWTPRKQQQLRIEQLNALKETAIFDNVQKVLTKGIARFQKIGYELPLDEIVVAILLGDSENDILMASKGYSGFGGIPGFILLFVVPNAYNQQRLPSALAHELNHNVRFTYEPFHHGNVSVEEYLVIEGLAEVFAEELYGIENRGPWVQDYDKTEMAYTIDVMKEGRNEKGFDRVSAYMYGDDVAKAQGYQPVGLARNAGYTIGYHLVKQYLNRTGQSIEQATLTPADCIIRESKIFQT